MNLLAMRNLMPKVQNLVPVGAECLSEGVSPSELLRRAGASVVNQSLLTTAGSNCAD